MVGSSAAELVAVAAAASEKTLDFPGTWNSFVSEAAAAEEFLAVAATAVSAALQFDATFAAAFDR